jgi:peptide chain release factor
MKKITEQANNLDLQVEVVEHEVGPEDGCMYSVTLSIEGKNITKLSKEWEGSILWVAQKNPFRPWHRRKNYFVGVHFIKPLESTQINEHDITYETMRASGPGGQNVNKVETAVRATHLPSGISVAASDMRSQSQNKKLAHERLLMKLSSLEDEKQMQHNRTVWMNHNTLERGNPVKKFKGDL